MRKMLSFVLLALLLIGSRAFAVDFPQDGSPFFFNSPTAYSSQYFDKILNAYNLQINPASETIPFTYAKSANGKASFNAAPTAYSPKQYHDIFTSYGLQLPVENVKNILTVRSYANVVGDEIKFGNSPMAYGGPEWKNILEAYSLPEMKAAAMATPMVEKPAVVAKPGDDDGDGVPNGEDACPDTPRYAAVDSRGCWALDSALLFDFDKSVIKKEYYSLLDATQKVFDEYPKMHVAVEGHADSTGPEAYNQNLSERRAKAVVEYLTKTVGIDAARLKAVGYGELKPAFSNDTKEGRAKNRRVQFSPMK